MYKGARNPAWKGGVCDQLRKLVCYNCGTEFKRIVHHPSELSGRSFCSKKCLMSWRATLPKTHYFRPIDSLKHKTVIPNEIWKRAYFAGFMDGEGSIFVRKDGYVQLSVSNTSLETLEWDTGTIWWWIYFLGTGKQRRYKALLYVMLLCIIRITRYFRGNYSLSTSKERAS